MQFGPDSGSHFGKSTVKNGYCKNPTYIFVTDMKLQGKIQHEITRVVLSTSNAYENLSRFETNLGMQAEVVQCLFLISVSFLISTHFLTKSSFLGSTILQLPLPKKHFMTRCVT